jgi:hypothetical protein
MPKFEQAIAEDFVIGYIDILGQREELKKLKGLSLGRHQDKPKIAH